METANSFLKYQIHDYDTKYQRIEIFLLSALSFLLPILIGHPQLLIGSLINMLLFRASLSMSFKKSLPIILLPSVGVLAGGLLFGGLTQQIIFFIPFIWIGNALYVLTSKLISHKFSKNYGVNVIAASVVKSTLIFSGAFLMVKVFGFPELFLIVMGLFQLYSALIGGFGAIAITYVEKKVLKK